MGLLSRAILAAFLILGAVAKPSVALEPVDVELVLAIDVSRSIDPVEAQLQRQGYIEAFRNPRVLQAIANGPLGRIGVTYFEWAAFDYQRMIVEWTVIHDAASARAFTDRIEAATQQSWGWTSISGAIDFAVPLFGRTFEGTRRVIDISGDGRNNSGRPASAARDEAVAQGITINGLAIMNDRTNFGRPPDRELDAWFRENVIGGPGSFLSVAEDFEAFGEAILNKLLKEIADHPAGGATGPGSDG